MSNWTSLNHSANFQKTSSEEKTNVRKQVVLIQLLFAQPLMSSIYFSETLVYDCHHSKQVQGAITMEKNNTPT